MHKKLYKKLLYLILAIITISVIFFATNYMVTRIILENDRLSLPEKVSFVMRKTMNNWTPYWKNKNSEGKNIGMPKPNDTEAWQKIWQKEKVDFGPKFIKKTKKKYNVTTKDHFIRGVRVLEIIPPKIEHKQSALIYAHPGGLYSYSPEALLPSTASVAVKTKTRVFSVDYRLLPQPEINLTIKDQAEDIEKAYKGLVEEYNYKPENIGIWGCSAGSTLEIIAINKMSKEGYPLPAAFAPNGGIYDMTMKNSDTIKTMRRWDVVIDPKNYIIPTIKMAKIDVKDPEISVLFEDYNNRSWPATMIVVGGREVLLSDAIQMNTKLKLTGHDSQLFIQDAMPHCWTEVARSREAKQFYQILDDFFKNKGVYN
jgi:acetyl esterase/lipase